MKLFFTLLVLVSVLDSAFAGCTGNTELSGQRGIIKSDNYPSSYPNSKDCTWRINVVGRGIKFAFYDAFGIENHASCGYDFVQLYKVTTNGASSIGKYCGTRSPGTVTVDSNRALIKFVSDGSQTGKGFYLIYTAITDGGWSEWSEFRDYRSCSVTCGNGTISQLRNRTCSNPATSGGGTPCSGSAAETRTVPCFVQECPIDGEWSSWEDSNTTQCSVSCGTGGLRVQTQSRTCNNPAPQFGGQYCNGSSSRTQERNCSAGPCPVNGGWGEWGNWTRHGACSVTCGDGLIAEKRNRTCDNPEPRYGGEQCVGQSEEGRSVECSVGECNGICRGLEGTKLAYTRDFSKYYECIDNQPVMKSCQNFYKFDATSASCVKICTSFGTETVGYPSDCFKYVQCVWGMTIVMNCPPGTAWSTSLSLCDHTGVANCEY